MFLEIFLGILIVSLALKLYIVFSIRWCTNYVCLVGKTVVITGANTGIGFQSGLDFAKRGARVILACRDKGKAEAAKMEIVRRTDNDNVVTKVLDLSSLQSVRDFANDIIKTENKIDVLVNNAGAGGLKKNTTKDGLEVAMQVNYFGPVLLTFLLLDCNRKAPKSRIINVSSMLAKKGQLDPKNLNKYTGYLGTYNDSKLGNILFTQKLAEKLKESDVSVFSLHPGVVATEIFRRFNSGWKKGIYEFFAKTYFKTPEEGAQTIIYTATEQDIEKYSGQNFDECQVTAPYPSASDPRLAEDVWNETCKLLKINDKDYFK